MLDLFAGSGVLGFEALSRGALSVTAVDSHRLVVRQLRETARELDAVGYDVVEAEAMNFLGASRDRPFDVIFADPPHADADYEALAQALDASDSIAPKAWIYVEFPTSRVSSLSFSDSWDRYRSSRAGQLTYQLWRREASDAD